MENLQIWKKKFQEKRKNTDFRHALKEIGSWMSLAYYKNQELISKIPPENGRIDNIAHFDEFEKNRGNLPKKGREYDSELTFFENYKGLLDSISLPSLINYGGNENSTYADMIFRSNNCYLSNGVINSCDTIAYSFSVKDYCEDVFNGFAIWDNSKNVYFSALVVESYKIFYSRSIRNCNNVWFSSNLTGCSECIFSQNLENASYYIENKKYEKEEYFLKKEEILREKEKFQEYYAKVDKIGKNIASENIKGNGFFNSENVENGFYGYNVKNARNVLLVGGVDGDENMYDVFQAGAPIANHFYATSGANGDNLYGALNITVSSHLFYCYNCRNSSFLLGCVGLENASYCILNKQYTKEERQQKINEVFIKMEQEGDFGKYFPAEINPFYFNDTVAGLIGGFKKEEVVKEGYLWRDDEVKVDIPEGSKVISTSEVKKYQKFDTEGKWVLDPEVMKVVIKDEKGHYYRIVQMEFDFLQKHNLPLPEIHWIDRIKINFGME